MEVDRHEKARSAGRRGASAPIHGVRVGRLVSAESGAAPQVVFAPGWDVEPVVARTTVSLSPLDAGREVLIVFEQGDIARPIVTGLLQEPAGDLVSALLWPGPPTGLVVDGKTLTVNAEKELVLQCGKSSLTLKSDGSVYIRGMRIVSRARGTNKVKGANVEIN